MVEVETKLVRYGQYKDSGVEWLGDIPEHWETRRIKYIFEEINERSVDGNEDLLSVSQYTGVTNKSDRVVEGEMLSNASTLEGYKKVKKGDLVSNIMLAWNGSLGFSPFDGITSPAYSIYRIYGKDHNRYFHYLLRTELYKSEFKRNSSGVIESRLRLYTDDFFDIRSILPPLSEQTAIAQYLDDKTTKIDEAIAIKEQQISLLKERKQILIHKAVTQGLNPNVKLKDSGVEWIGAIPEHWALSKLGFLTYKIGDGLHGTPNYSDGTEFYFINGNNLSSGNIEITEQTKTVSEREYLLNKKELNNNTLLISINGTIGNVASYCGEKVMLGKSAAYLNFHDNINIEYVKWFLKSSIFQNYYELELSGSTINNFSLYSIGKTPIVMPSKDEQKELVDYLKSISQKIETAISLKQQEIEKLKEYKSSLINGVVTGKIKVC